MGKACFSIFDVIIFQLELFDGGKQMKKTIIIIAVIVVLAVAIFAVYKVMNQEKTPPVGPVESGEAINDKELAALVKIEPVTVRNKTDNIDINAVYPRITSFKNKEFENYINKQIASSISEYRSEINSIVDDLTPDVKLYKYITTYQKDTWGNYLTLVIDQNYQTQGIRSDKWKDIYNIDVSKERIIMLADLFESGVDFETAIISEITKQAEAKNIILMGGDGLKKLPTKQKFYIQNGKLVIYFDPSEAAAAIFGALEFEMPYKINENGYFEI